MKQNFLLRTWIVCSVFGLLITPVWYPLTVTAASWESSYTARKEDIQSKINRLNDDLQKVTTTAGDLTKQKNNLQDQVAQLETEITDTDRIITETKETITQVEGQIETKNKELKDLQEQLNVLIREIQKQERLGPLQAILTSENFSDVLSRTYSLSALQNQAEKLRQRAEDVKKELQTNKKNLDDTKKSLEDTKALQKSKQDSLKLLLEQTKGEETKYQELLQSMKGQQQELQNQSVQVDKEQEEERQRRDQQNSGGNGGGGSGLGGGSQLGPNCPVIKERQTLNVDSGYFVRPVASGPLTNDFGCRYYYHDGTDYGVGVGTPVRSIAAGTIHMIAAQVDKNGHYSGYGNYIIIRHVLPSGQTIYSLYAHLNQLPAGPAGQVVSKGEVIGYSGCTGYTIPAPCGPHLHFMIISGLSPINSWSCVSAWGARSACFDPLEAPFNFY